MYRLSSDLFSTKVTVAEVDDPQLAHDSLSFQDISVGDYVAAEYDKDWYVGLVVTKIQEENDFLLSFMKCDKDKGVVSWPSRKDECFVPTNSILCILPSPIKENVRKSSSRRTTTILTIPKVCLDNAQAILEAK